MAVLCKPSIVVSLLYIPLSLPAGRETISPLYGEVLLPEAQYDEIIRTQNSVLSRCESDTSPFRSIDFYIETGCNFDMIKTPTRPFGVPCWGCIGDSFKGRTRDFDSLNRGSSPRSSATNPEGLAFGV